MRKTLVILLLNLVSGVALAQNPKRCDEVRSDAAKLLDSAAQKSTLDDRVTLVKPASDAVLNLNLCRTEDFIKRDIVMVNMDATLESQLSAFMYDQALALAKQSTKDCAGTVRQ